MKSRSLLSMSIAAATLLMSGASSQAGISSPLMALYRVNGVRDNGAASNAGVATAFQCTNWNTVNESVQIFVKDSIGAVVGSTPKIGVSGNGVLFISTHLTVLFNGLTLTGGINIHGSALILGTSSQISCTAMIVDASAAIPNGIALHMIRFNALAGSQE